MTIRSAFNFYSHSGQQRLHQDLVTEAIQIIGMDVCYLPARRLNFDKLYGASDITTYDTVYTIEMYLETYAGFAGDQSFMSKFGLEIRDQIFLTVSHERFHEEVGIPEGFPRPREADLVYFPLNNKCFTIFYVDNKPTFYPFGKLPMYKLTCELFEASSERFTTGIPGIDRLNKSSQDMYGWSYTDVNGVPYTDQAGNVLLIDSYAVTTYDALADNKELTKETDTFVSWSEVNPWGDIEK